MSCVSGINPFTPETMILSFNGGLIFFNSLSRYAEGMAKTIHSDLETTSLISLLTEILLGLNLTSVR